jgi:signal transduction histidine kinase
MAGIRYNKNGLAAQAEAEHFKHYYPLILSIMEEIQPLLDPGIDTRQVLAMASMHLGQLLRRSRNLGRRDLRHSIEQYLVDTFAINGAESLVDGLEDEKAGTSDELRGSRILVVDDSDMARRQIQFFLKRDGFEVYEAKSGEEALWLINEVDPDLVLMDIMMDGIDGFEVCRRIKEDAENGSLPIIFLSARGEREEIVRGFNCGATDYIVKPFHPAESLTRIRTHLHVRRLVKLREKHIRELKVLNATKDRILRVASHDLRNPIAAIAGLAEFLNEDTDNLNDSQKDLIACIADASHGVVGLLNELLDVSTISNGTACMTPQKEVFNLSGMIRNLVRLFKGEAERKDIRIEYDCAAGTPEILADRQQLRQVGDNLISNAIKFTPIGGKVTVRCRPEADGGVRLEVEDNGPGIAPEDAGRLFKEFGTTANKPTGNEKSTGLGLSICRRIVCAHGGRIDFTNLPEGGIRFSVILPAT